MADIEFDKKNISFSPSNVLDLSITMSNVGVPWGINGPIKSASLGFNQQWTF